MSTFKKTWIDDYSTGRLVSLKNHCNGKSHMKASHSFKVPGLKIPVQVGQKEIDTSLSPGELKRLKRKANIAYFATKNDILFKKFPNLIDLDTREGNLNFEKDIGYLYVNKDVCWKSISTHGEVSVMDVAEFVSKSNFFSILMDGSTIHRKEKKVYTFSRFQKMNL